jgi:hypothetical protein
VRYYSCVHWKELRAFEHRHLCKLPLELVHPPGNCGRSEPKRDGGRSPIDVRSRRYDGEQLSGEPQHDVRAARGRAHT